MLISTPVLCTLIEKYKSNNLPGNNHVVFGTACSAKPILRLVHNVLILTSAVKHRSKRVRKFIRLCNAAVKRVNSDVSKFCELFIT